MFIKGHLHSLLHFYTQSNLPPVPFPLRKMHENKKKIIGEENSAKISQTLVRICAFFSYQNNNIRTGDLPGTLRYGLTGSFMTIPQ